MTQDPVIVAFLQGRVFVFPTGLEYCRCVARTTSRKRCRLPVDYCPTGDWRMLYSARGAISVYDMTDLDEHSARSWLDQHCQTHDGPGVIDEVAPEWERFDPDGRHAGLVRPLPETWEYPTGLAQRLASLRSRAESQSLATATPRGG